MGWGITPQKQSLIRYQKVIGNSVVYIYQTVSYSYTYRNYLVIEIK